VASRVFQWLSTDGGAWSLASNWTDVTDGVSPSLLVPGAQDSVTVAGPTGATVQTVTGPGAALAAAFSGNTILSGGFGFGTVALGGSGSGGLLQLASGTDLAAGSAAITSGSVLAGAGSTLSVSSSLVLGSAAGYAAALNATGGARVTAGTLLLSGASDSLYVDPSSILEIGQAGNGSAGRLTIDAGATLSGQGDANAYGQVANNGTVAASGGTLMVGTLSGTGTLQIGAGATVALNGPCGAGQTVRFSGANATLAIDEEYFAPAGTLSGFAAGDAIDIVGSPISSASYTATGAGEGVLTLSYGGQVAARLDLSGITTGAVFLTSGDGDGGTLITMAAGGGGGGSPSPGTQTPDQYLWLPAGSGSWNTAANWEDQSTGATPAAIAPGAADLVSIAASQGSFSVIAGPGNAATLGLTGEVALSGAYGIGTLAVGEANGTGFTSGTLDLVPGASIGAASAAIAAGAISLSGSATSLTVAGTLTLGGGVSGVGLPVTSLIADAGAVVQAASLVMGGGSGDSITTDPTGSVEIGTAGGAAAGAVTIDAGATLSGNGSINPLGKIIDNGTILATGGTLTLGSVTGSGSLAVAPGGTLELEATTANPITLAGSLATGSVLAFADARAAPAGTITGFGQGDAIDLEGSPLTAVQYATSAASNVGTMLLIYGSTVVARLYLAGSYGGMRLVATPDGSGGTEITLSQATGGGGGPGQSGTDALSWTAPVSGNWSTAGNWTDTTLGQTATSPPGGQTPVTITGPEGTSVESITGTGTCASLDATGNTVLSGVFSVGQLTVGGTATGEGLLEATNGATIMASGADVAQGELIASGSGAEISLSGTLEIGGGSGGGSLAAVLVAQNRSTTQLGGLLLATGAADSVTVDAGSSIEVGTLGGAAAGALTIDPGSTASGQGNLDSAGTIIDNGLVEALGGTLEVGAISGAGTLAIGTEAALALATATAMPIMFAGGGASLILPGTAQSVTSVITGFAPGDSILTGQSSVSAVSYQPGNGGLGTLTLSQGTQTLGTLMLAGSYAGDSFAVLPAGEGSQIIVSAPGTVTSQPPAGTSGLDDYLWTGAQSTAWADAANWTDTTEDLSPAAVAPGANDSVSIAGGTDAVTLVIGPADAAELALSGTVSLAGTYAVGTLSAGNATQTGLLALDSGACVTAAVADVVGGVALQGGTLSVAETLALGGAEGGGVLAALGQSRVQLGGLLLAGSGDAVSTDGTASVEIGGAYGGAPGCVTIDPGGVLLGAGAVNLAGTVIDNGTITASGGTLALGTVSGTGTLLAGVGAELLLSGIDGAGLTVDFAGAGTLSVSASAWPATGAFAPAIADFGPGDEILLPFGGATSAAYAQTAPGEGVLTIDDGSQNLAELTLLGGDLSGLSFTVTETPGGGTELTASDTTGSTQEGSAPVTGPISNSGTQVTRAGLLSSFETLFPTVSQTVLGDLIGEEGIYLWTSVDGTAPQQTVFGGSGEAPGVNLEIVDITSQTGTAGIGPGGLIVVPAGYCGVLLEGSESLDLLDNAIGNALLVGNAGGGLLATLENNDTLVGAAGANTTFTASLSAGQAVGSGVNVSIVGGGNDLMVTNNDNADITTSDGRSTVFLGSAYNDVISNGTDTIVCGGTGIASDTITAQAGAGSAGDVAFGPAEGMLNFIGGSAPATVVGNGGDIVMKGGSGNNNELWAGNSQTEYIGGTGSAIIVGGSANDMVVQGGTGVVTVFGGTGSGVYSGQAGSIFVVGLGQSTVNASGASTVYLTGTAAVSVAAGGSGVDAYGGNSAANDAFQAGAGTCTLWGGAGNDTFTAGTGSAIFVGGSGDNVFNFINGDDGGTDTIVGFVPGNDVIALHGYGTQMPSITVAFGDSFVNLSDGTQIIVENVTNLTSASFTFS